MSNCSNCYNGCTEIVSDKCIKYTGIDVPVLGIQTGDSLSYVEQALITFLTSALDGTGIQPIINSQIICDLVDSYLPTCKDINLNDVLSALIKSTCDLQEQVDLIAADVATLNGNYTIGCLAGVTSSSDTHAIVQAIITKLCDLQLELTALALDLSVNYSSNGTELDNYIGNYIANNSPSADLINSRMVPYSVIPYFGPLSNFSSTGVGLGDWVNIYLCNGANGTPDLRGRVPVGVTAVPGGGAYSPQVDPALGNPTYTLASPLGTNGVTLTSGQMPSHSHNNTVSISPNPHSHTLFFEEYATGTTGNPGFDGGDNNYAMDQTKTTSETNLTVSITNASAGSGESHPNFQPGLGCYYIQYRPV
jgi:microcystin-dependent protein